MKVASVIVDVPTYQTDKPFDYLIPKKYEGTLKRGMRVIVPFGPRKVQGFIIDFKNESSVDKLREIIEPMDAIPVLNQELLQLGQWLTDNTLCYKITAFQAMLPVALKAKYNKKARLINEAQKDNLGEQLQSHFQNRSELSWREILAKDLLALVQQAVEKGLLEIVYEVSSRHQKRLETIISPLKSAAQLIAEIDNLPSNAIRQREVLNFFATEHKAIERSELLRKLKISSSTINSLIKRGILGATRQEVYRDPYENRSFEKTKPLKLTEEQSVALTTIEKSLAREEHDVFLLYGITGSGKTEIYLQAIANVIDKGQQAIVLVPEISLTPQMVKRFKGRFGDEVAVLHSGLSVGEKYDEWRKINRNEVSVVVGARSAVFAPFENLGIIIIDEEHEGTYKQEDMPRYHARDVAIERAKTHNCPVVLGSATPSLESFARASKQVYQLLTLRKRINKQPLPEVEIIDMREELRSGNRSMFSTVLFEKISDRLQKREQTVLLLNKRGHSTFIMCRDCGYVVNCPNCDISLTYHLSTEQMKCHYCGYEDQVPKDCPQCCSKYIRYFGTGTQKVEAELGKLLPEARVIRMDVDTTSRKGAHERLLDKFQRGEGDILLGTQMIAKGLDFPNITLVGVLSADTMLHLPDFRAAEKTFQLLTQVSGRAGRHQLLGEVIIQTYTPNHYSVELAGDQDYNQFYNREMVARKLNEYPPFYFLAQIIVSHEQLNVAIKTTQTIASYVKSNLSKTALVLGPVASPLPRINNRYRYQCLIKYKREPNLNKTLKTVLDRYQRQILREKLTISIDLNPYMMM